MTVTFLHPLFIGALMFGLFGHSLGNAAEAKSILARLWHLFVALCLFWLLAQFVAEQSS